MHQIQTHYVGQITDTHRWEAFKHRSDDIFICTPPKCGTTWTQAICASLVFGTADHGQSPAFISPWIDAKLDPLEEYLKVVDAQPHRRFIKTHTPLDGIPFYPSSQYLAVFRDPREAYISGSNHRDNMNNRQLAESTFPSGDNAFDFWLYGENKPGGWDKWTLHALVHLFKTYWDAHDRSNIHLFHYSDMKANLPRAISQMAVALGYEYGEDKVAEFAKAASFEHMKKNAGQFAPQAKIGFWKSDSSFFNRGDDAAWSETLTPEQLTAFDERIRQLLDDDQIDWLLAKNTEGSRR